MEGDLPGRSPGEVRILMRMGNAMEIYSEESLAATDDDDVLGDDA